MAEYAKVFGMQVIAWSQNLTEEAAAAVGARRVEKAALFEESDVVSIHLVLSERTRGLVAEPELALMKPQAYLVNTSRGPIVDEAALIAALRTRRIAGAGLDVYDSEPLPPDHPLRLLPNVTLSPHLGYVTREMLSAFYSDTVAAVEAWLDGTPIRIANPEALQRRTYKELATDRVTRAAGQDDALLADLQVRPCAGLRSGTACGHTILSRGGAQRLRSSG